MTLKYKFLLRIITFISLVVIVGIILNVKYPTCSRPAVILIVFDALRADHLSCYGYPKKTTPNIDRFALDAVLFENAVSPTYTTAPSFMSLFTALRPKVHGTGGIDPDGSYQRLSNNITTLPMVMKKSGYFTVGFAAITNLSAALGFGRGFDIYKERYYSWPKEGIAMLSDVIKKSRKEGKPVFVFIHTAYNHLPYVHVPREFAGRFLKHPVKGLPVSSADIKSIDDEENILSRFDFSRPQHLQHLLGLYDSAIYYSDYIFGEIRKMLEEEGLYENALLIILADHGEQFFEHGQYGHIGFFAETLHVPLIIKFPNNRYAGVKIPEYLRTMDLMPTILDYLDVRSKVATQGVSFMPLLEHQGTYNPLIVSEDFKGKAVRFIKDGFVYSNRREAIGNEFLFDLKDDPAEQRNLVSQRPEILQRMRKIARQIVEEDKEMANKIRSKPEKFVLDDSNALKELKALGYAQ